MLGRNKILLIVFGVAAIMFIYELERLFQLGFTRGDAYPYYSTFRSDPLGLRVFYNSLGSIRGVSANRNLDPLTKLGNGKGKTLFICGANTESDPVDLLETLENFVAQGGRLVITFFPSDPEFYLKEMDHSTQEAKKKPEKEDVTAEVALAARFDSIQNRWDFSIAYAALPKASSGEKGDVYALRIAGPTDLPASVSWRSVMYFDKLGDKWRPIYSMDGRAVVMERPFGDGTIALLGDTYLLSNQAMREERYPSLLAWLVGNSQIVIFDETHLGVAKNPGIASLMWSYRLQWLVGAIIMVAGLFIWKNATSLAPKRSEAEEIALAAEGKDSTAGLVNLLRRSIPSNKILSVCLDEWQASFARDPKFKDSEKRRARAIVNAERSKARGKGDPVKAFGEIQTILSGRKKK